MFQSDSIFPRPSFLTLALAVIFTMSFAAGVSAAPNYGPVGIPKTLLALYQESDVIAVARFARTDRGTVSREDSDFSVLATRRYFDIAYVLKGEHSKFLVLNDEEFLPKDAPASVNAEQTVDDEYHLLAGDTVLLFLRRGEDGKGLELVNSDDSIKKLSGRDLAVYEARIADLRTMFDIGRPEPAKILDWIVKCVAEPATRWEGAFELIVSFERAEYQKKHADATARQNIPAIDVMDRSIFATLITDTQKHELADILLADATANDKEVRGDIELTELVSKWGDARLPAHLIRLIKDDPKPSFTLTTRIRTLLRLLDDKKANGLADKVDEVIAMNSSNSDDGPMKAKTALMRLVNYAESKLPTGP